MTKKSSKTKVLDTCCPAAVGDYKPTLYLDLEGQDVSQIKGLAVGEEGEFIVRGKIVGLEMNERESSDEKGKTEKRKTGSIRIKEFTVEVMGAEDNEYVKMAKDEEADA